MKEYYKSTLLPTEYYAFVAYVGLPRALRVPATEKEFLESINVGKNQGHRWRALPNFNEDVLRASLRWSVEMNADVFGAIYIAAVKDRNPFSQKIWLDHVMKMAFSLSKNDEENLPEKQSLTELLKERYEQRQKLKAKQNDPDANNSNRSDRE